MAQASEGGRFRLVCFDFDGTLADSEQWFLRAWNQVAEEFGFKKVGTEDYALARGWDTRRILKHLEVPLIKLPLIMTRMRSLASHDYSQIRLFPRIPDVLTGLMEAGLQCGIVSSNAEETIRGVLGADLVREVSFFACGASMFGKASKLKGVLRKSRVVASDAIYVGDETRDAEAARSVGMEFGAVSWGYAAVELLEKHAPRFVFRQPDDILEALRGSVNA